MSEIWETAARIFNHHMIVDIVSLVENHNLKYSTVVRTFLM